MYETINPTDLKYVGKKINRVDSAEKLIGAEVFTADYTFPGMLHAQVKRSPHARAKILRVNTSKAEKLPGVRAILTGDELDYKLGMYVVDKDILAKGVVRYAGEGVAAVAADTLAIAKKAVDLIAVEYEVLPPLLDPLDAIKKDASLVHPDLGKYDYLAGVFAPQPGTNIAHHAKVRKGDVEKGFREAHWIVEREYSNPQVQHVAMETHVCIVVWGPKDKVTIWTSEQSVFLVRKLFCHTFKLPHNNVRVIIPCVGGGFGGKAGLFLEPLVACLSKETGGRPVKFYPSREEEFNLLPCRSALIQRIKTGIQENGKIIAQKTEMFWDTGAYADYAVNVTRATAYSCSGPYEIPNAWVDGYTIYTNKVYGTAYRGFGNVEFSWGVERHMDLCARITGMDPLEFRKINALKPGSLTLTGERITEHTGNILKCMEAVSNSVHYGEITEEEKDRENRTGMKIGKAVGCLQKAPAIPTNTGTAVVLKMNEDGTLNINSSGTTEIGQGSYTALMQIVAERMNFPLEKIYVSIDNDSDKDPYDWLTAASHGITMSGDAAILAVEDLLEKAYSIAAQALNADSSDLVNDGDGIYIKGHPERHVTWKEIAIGYTYPNGNSIGGPLIGTGRYIAQGLTNISLETSQGLPAWKWTYGSYGIIVEVDPETGMYNIIKVAGAFDVGRVINPQGVRGQILGGMVQGMGTAMCEGFIYDSEGHLLNPSFTDNKIPTAMDLPEAVDVIVVETPFPHGPYGARGVAEHPMIGFCGVLGNAIRDACGADLTHMPMRWEDVWRGMNHMESLDKWVRKGAAMCETLGK